MDGSHPDSFTVTPGGPLVGDVHVPGDKSISHRALLFSALAKGPSTLTGLLEGEDVLATAAAFRAMGIAINHNNQGTWEVQGKGLRGLSPPAEPLACGNSGTTLRLLMGLLAAQPFPTTLVGDFSLMQRPMARVADPLRQMGANITLSEQGTAPVHIQPASASLQGIHYVLPVASAQVKSAILLAGLYAQGETTVEEPATTRDHTERFCQALGLPLTVAAGKISVHKAKDFSGGAMEIPGDLSSAAFLLVGATLLAGSDLWIRKVGVNPTRTGVLQILKRMGADITRHHERLLGNEPVADLRVRGGSLHGVELDAKDVALAIDELPILFIAATQGQGVTRVRGAEELRHKESDRLAVMANGLTALGAKVTLYEDGMDIYPSHLTGGEVDSAGDHRIAMAFAMAAGVAKGPVKIRQTKAIATSFPNFLPLIQTLGVKVT